MPIILAEKDERLGGQMVLAGMTPHKEVVLDAFRWFGEEAERAGNFLNATRSAFELAYTI